MTRWIRSSLFLLTLTGLTLTPLSEADAALAHLTLKGQKQGQIKGSCALKGHEDAIEVLAVSHEILAPYNAGSGMPTGKRQHKPLTITKAIDKSSPILMSVLTNNENLPEWELKFYTKTGKGPDTLVYTIKLTDASSSRSSSRPTPAATPTSWSRSPTRRSSGSGPTAGSWASTTGSKSPPDSSARWPRRFGSSRIATFESADSQSHERTRRGCPRTRRHRPFGRYCSQTSGRVDCVLVGGPHLTNA